MKTFFYFVTPPLTLAKTVPKSYQTDNWGLFFFIWEGVKNTLRGESPNLAAEGHKTLTPPRHSCEMSEHVLCLLIEILQ